MLNTCSKECTGCGACVNVCPKKCIRMEKNKEHFYEARLNKKECINCNMCNLVCPVQTKKSLKYEKEQYILQLKDTNILKKCASGGAFYGIASYFIKNGGIVYGVSTNSNKSLEYTRVENKDDLLKLIGSKYYQCLITENDYAKIINDSKNKKVLVSGTPCQMSAIKNMKAINQDNVYTLEIICQGTPNEFIVKKYYEAKEKKKNKRIKEHIFRSKDKYVGKNYLNKYIFDDNSIEYLIGEKDELSLAFQRNIFLRNSCYKCKYTNKDRVSDFVVGDYWKQDCSNSDINYNNGVSALLCNSKRGISLFRKIELFNYEKRKENVFIDNIPFNRSVKKPFSRFVSFKLIKLGLKPKLVTKICCYKYYLKRILKGENK